VNLVDKNNLIGIFLQTLLP